MTLARQLCAATLAGTVGRDSGICRSAPPAQRQRLQAGLLGLHTLEKKLGGAAGLRNWLEELATHCRCTQSSRSYRGCSYEPADSRSQLSPALMSAAAPSRVVPRCDSPSTGPAGATLARSSARLRPAAGRTQYSLPAAPPQLGAPAPPLCPAPQLGPTPCRAAGGSHPGKCRRHVPAARLRATAVGREDYKSRQAVCSAQAQTGSSAGTLPHLLRELCRSVNRV